MPHQCTECGRQFDDGSKEMLSGCPDCGGTKFQFLPDGQADRERTPEEPPAIEESGSSVARKVGSAATAVRDFVGSSGTGRAGGTEHTAGPDSPPAPGTESTPGQESNAASTAQPTDSTPAPSSAPSTTPGESLSSSEQPSSSTPESPSSQPKRSDRSPPTAGSQTSVPSSSSSQGTDDARGPTPERLREPEPAAMQTADSENDAQASARSEVISPDELPPAPEQSGWAQTTPGPQTDPPSSDPDEQPTDQSAQADPPEQADRPDLSELRAELNQQFESIKVLEPGQYELNLMELFDREEYIVALQEDGKYTVQVPEHWQD